MWLTTRTLQQHVRCRTKLVLMRCQLQIMSLTPNNFFECITDQLSGGTRVTGEEIHHTVHQFVIRNESLLEVSICRFSMYMYNL